jgi:hypothetical protein
MAERQPLKATFFALQQRPRMMLLPGALVLLVIVVLIAAAAIAINWSFIQQLSGLIAHPPSKTTDDAMAWRMVSGMFLLIGSVFLLLFPLYFAFAAYEAACLRWMIRGEAPGLFGFAFDHDMWRVYGVYWCWFIGQMAISYAMSILLLPFTFAAMGQILAGGRVTPNDFPHWMLTVQLPLALLQYAPLLFFGVRFAPAAATCVARRRFSFFEAWTVTRDRFWAMFGSFAVLWLIAVLAGAVVGALVVGGLVAHVWPLVVALFQEQSEANSRALFAALFAPETLLFIGVNYLGQFVVMLWLAVMSYGVNARAALVALDEGKIAVVPVES